MAQLQQTIIVSPADVISGRTKLVIVDHLGPKSYVTGGETFPAQPSTGGPNSLGLSNCKWCSGGFTESGNYYVVPIFGGNAAVKGTITLKWFSSFGGQVAPTTNLSAEVIRLQVLGG